MFQSDAYEGLPFVGQSRLRRFLGAGEEEESLAEAASSDDDAPTVVSTRAFLREYFQAQEKAYHILLDLVDKVSYHTDYWLDWTTPVRRRPLWAHRAARRVCAGYLAMMGRGEQTSAPSRAAKQFMQLHAELCRLVAFVKVSSYELLTFEDQLGESHTDALRQAAHGLACQVRAVHALVSALALRPVRLKPARLSAAMPAAPEMPAGGDSAEELLRKGREHLEDSRAAMGLLERNLTGYMHIAGRLKHLSKTWPLYVAMGMGASIWACATLRDGSARVALRQHVTGVCRQFWSEWVRNPLSDFFAELFRRLTTDDALLVQLKELRAEQHMLGRMLADFSAIVHKDPDPHFQVVSPNGMDDLAERYFEWSLSRPVTNVLHGHLLESCMVQSQRMKVLLYASLYSIDTVLAQLKWDFLMAGVMPLMSLCGLSCWLAASSRKRRLQGWRRKMVRALAEVDRFLIRNSQSLPARRETAAPGSLEAQLLLSPPAGARGRLSRASTSDVWGNGINGMQLELEKVGACLSHLDALCRLASHVRLEDADWRSFQRDILALTSPELSAPQKLNIVAMMRGTYNVFSLGSA